MLLKLARVCSESHTSARPFRSPRGASGQETVVNTNVHNKGRRGAWSRDTTTSAFSRPPIADRPPCHAHLSIPL